MSQSHKNDKTIDFSQGGCAGKEKLFTSDYLEPFDAESFKELNPDFTEDQLFAIERDHTSKHYMYIAACRKVCSECPILQQCNDWANSQTNEIFGVVAGATEKEREEAAREGKTNLLYSGAQSSYNSLFTN